MSMNPFAPFLRQAGRNRVRLVMRHTDSRSCTPVAENLFAEARKRGGHYLVGVTQQLSHIGYGYLSKNSG